MPQTPNASQQEVINHRDGRCIVMASAGSGKTFALIKRAESLVDSGVDPASIILTTFTKQAAGELVERLKTLMSAGIVNRMKVSTLHSLCYRYLLRFVGRGRYSRVLLPRDQYDTIRNISKGLRYRVNPRDILDQLAHCKNNLIPREEWKQEFLTRRFPTMNMTIAQIYEETKEKKKYLDFDDMLFHLYELFEDQPQVLKTIQKEAKYIMVDESQDNNTTQLYLVEKMGQPEGNVMLVGDENQSIFSFRGARPDIFINWANDKITKIFFDKNYRSAPCIIKAANNLISHNSIRVEKSMDEDTNIEGHVVRKDFDTRNDEAEELGFMLSQYKEKYDIPYKEIAFIYRTNAQAQAFEDTLSRRKIPYQIIGGTSFFERPEIADVLAYLRLSYDPFDDVSLLRIANRPYRALGDKWVREVEKNSQNSIYLALSSVYTSKAHANQSKHLYETLTKLQNYAETHTVEETISWILQIKSPWSKGMTLRDYWASEKNKEKILREGSTKLENVLTLAAMGRAFTSCEKFVQHIQTLLSNFTAAQEEEDKVNLLTVHKAKGKEYRLVFVVGLNENILPHKNALLGIGQVGVAQGAKGLTGEEEERRICYVAITRAKQYLVLSSFRNWGYSHNSSQFNESRFIRELNLPKVRANS